jgi:hypothetical protein
MVATDISPMVIVLVHYSSLILGTLVSVMTSDCIVTIHSDHWGKIFADNHFVGFWRLVGLLFLSLGFFAILYEFVSPYIELLLISFLPYLVGTWAIVVCVFFLWIVFAFDYDIKTQRKWVFPVICIVVTVLNFVIVAYWSQILKAFGFG